MSKMNLSFETKDQLYEKLMKVSSTLIVLKQKFIVIPFAKARCKFLWESIKAPWNNMLGRKSPEIFLYYWTNAFGNMFNSSKNYLRPVTFFEFERFLALNEYWTSDSIMETSREKKRRNTWKSTTDFWKNFFALIYGNNISDPKIHQNFLPASKYIKNVLKILDIAN